MLQPQEALQAKCYNPTGYYGLDAVISISAKLYKRNDTTGRGAANEMMQPQKALQASFCNLKRHHKEGQSSSDRV